ncbi:hypothetical protein PG996_000208 [Apiospora saccharicola]|uniref:Uncharacterized protein n=1 Tax=Apiospora saccharicola TaxID=335842 RepID=A0ABR1WEH6_9PEZI
MSRGLEAADFASEDVASSSSFPPPGARHVLWKPRRVVMVPGISLSYRLRNGNNWAMKLSYVAYDSSSYPNLA